MCRDAETGWSDKTVASAARNEDPREIIARLASGVRNKVSKCEHRTVMSKIDVRWSAGKKAGSSVARACHVSSLPLLYPPVCTRDAGI